VPFSAIFVPDALASALSDEAWLEALLTVERALVRAQARAGVVPAEAADAVAAACDGPRLDPSSLAAEGRAPGNPVEPLVRALRARAGDEAAPFVHRGATSQDILDSAAMLVAREATRLVEADLDAVAGRCALLADEHRSTVMAARTLLQQAVPTTFGYKAAGWLAAVHRATGRLAAARDALPAQLGGAAGTLAAYEGDGIEILGLFADELGLREPTLPWHTHRAPVAELGAALAGAAGVLGKIARDVVLLAQTEVGEVAEAAGGVSSTMPHKQNPVGAVLALACERHARANAALLDEGLVAEHERAAGAWHAEWHALTSLLAAAGGAASAVRRSLEGLRVDAARMRSNLDAATLSEAQRLGIDARRPEDYLGSVDRFVDRALALLRP